MTSAKVIRVKSKLRSESKSKQDEIKGQLGAVDDLTGQATIPNALAPIELLVRRDLPKAYVRLAFMANRNKDGLKPREWYRQICEALDIEPEEPDGCAPGR